MIDPALSHVAIHLRRDLNAAEAARHWVRSLTTLPVRPRFRAAR